MRSGPAARAARRRGLLARARRQVGAPPIIPRAAWGGDGVTPRAGPVYGQVALAFVHHTVNANEYGPEDSAAIVLGIARYHRDHNGWNDIGYNFLVDRYGQIFEGRAGGIEAAIVGAQTQGFNSVSTGIACIGTFTALAPPAVALEAIAQVIGWKLSLHGVPVQGTVAVTSSSGASATFQRVSGHRDGNSTACPGDVLYGLLPDLRIRAAQYAGPLAGVTLRAASTKLRGVTSALLSGALRFADGSSPTGAPIEILYAGAGAGFAVIATVRCAADGSGARRSTCRGRARSRHASRRCHAHAARVERAGDHRRATARAGRLPAARPPPPPDRRRGRRDTCFGGRRRRLDRAPGARRLPPRASPPQCECAAAATCASSASGGPACTA